MLICYTVVKARTFSERRRGIRRTISVMGLNTQQVINTEVGC